MHWSEAKSTLLQNLIQVDRPGLVTDMDGTISPIVPRPEDAQVTQRSRELLEALKAHMTVVAVVSGRSVADLRARVGLDDLVYTGNHGMERWNQGEIQINPAALEFRPAIARALNQLTPVLEKIPG
ncbi:MAG TPA: trehalose-phosphatase, partial [Phototrophicaceae bacterium]|nr:trehalose-phosphatase [Phototrophicaceae bacterium]